MADSDLALQSRDSRLARSREILRRASLGMAISLLAQYALGMVVNLYVSVPGRDQGGGFFPAIGRALANGPVALTVHAAVGILLVLSAISLLVRAVAARHRPVIWLAVIGLLAIVGAAGSGASFVDSGRDGASLAMALLTGVALLCSVISLYVLAPGGQAAAGGRGKDGPPAG